MMTLKLLNIIEPKDIKIFNPNVTSSADIHKNFRILGKTPKRHGNQGCKNANAEDLVAYTNGSCTQNRETNVHAGFGVWFSHGDPHNPLLAKTTMQQSYSQSTEPLQQSLVHKDHLLKQTQNGT